MPYTKERNCGAYPGKDFAAPEWCAENSHDALCIGVSGDVCPKYKIRREVSPYMEKTEEKG